VNIQCFQLGFNTCPPYFKVESKITRDFEAQCSLFTYSAYICCEYYVDKQYYLSVNYCVTVHITKLLPMTVKLGHCMNNDTVIHTDTHVML